MGLETFTIKTSMGKVSTLFGHPLHFLSDQEKENLDEIGYSGKLNEVKTSRSEYLNSLGKGEFLINRTKADNGDFREVFIVSRYTK
jgi:hypothetical protein